LQARRDLLIALLEKTRKEPVDRDELRAAVRVTDEVYDQFLDQLSSESLIEDNGTLLEASLSQRMELATRAVKAGIDFERVGRALGWLEFEEMVAYVFEENGYRVSKRFRFTADGRRWEIDVLALRRPLIVCAECKHWSRGLGNMTARRIAETHMEKVRVLSQNVGNLESRLRLEGWNKATVVPIALSLQPARNKIYRRIPVVSIFELPDFISEFEGQMEWLAKFPVVLP
jgi:hypothetical protein